MCANRKVIVGAAAVGIILFVAAPNLVRPVLPILLMATCPLSMLFMSRLMTRGSESPKTASAPSADRDGEVQRLRDEVESLRSQLQAPSASATTDRM